MNYVQFTWNGCQWNSIPSFPDYAASKCGKIARITAYRRKQAVPYLKTQFIDAHGYSIVGIGGNNRKVHKLVCEAWRGPAHGEHIYCCFLDGNRRNVCVENLIWATMAMKTDLINTNSPNIKLDMDKARRIRKVFSEQGEDCVEHLAAAFGVSPSTVMCVVKGKTWKERVV